MGGSNAISRAHYPKSPLGDLAAREGDGGAEGFGCLFDDELGRRWLCKLPEEEWDRDGAYMGPIRFVLCPSGVVIILEDDGIKNLELREMY